MTIQGRKPAEITEVLNKFPYQMSGGQKQHVASVRAIVTNLALFTALIIVVVYGGYFLATYMVYKNIIK